MSEPSEGAVTLRDLASLAANRFSSTTESIQALLETIAAQLGLRTSFLTEISIATGTNHIVAAYNAPGGSGVPAGSDLPLGNTF